MLKRILSAISKFARQTWVLPQSVANAVTQRQRRVALHEHEAERLDRIRNPSKYLGK